MKPGRVKGRRKRRSLGSVPESFTANRYLSRVKETAVNSGGAAHPSAPVS